LYGHQLAGFASEPGSSKNDEPFWRRQALDSALGLEHEPNRESNMTNINTSSFRHTCAAVLLSSISALSAQTVSFGSNETIELASGWIAIAQPSGFYGGCHRQPVRRQQRLQSDAGLRTAVWHRELASAGRGSVGLRTTGSAM
jgi:hypothetical protein